MTKMTNKKPISITILESPGHLFGYIQTNLRRLILFAKVINFNNKTANSH